MAYFSQEDKKSKAPTIKTILKKYGVKGTLAVKHSSTFVINIKEGPIDFLGNMFETSKKRDDCYDDQPRLNHTVNEHHIDTQFTGKAKDMLLEVKEAMMEGNHDNSDYMTDYFDVGWYIAIKIGTWDKPYIFKGELTK